MMDGGSMNEVTPVASLDGSGFAFGRERAELPGMGQGWDGGDEDEEL